MKTTKQIADELGIDKQKVYRYIKRNHISEVQQINGVMYYDETAEKGIKKAFSEKGTRQEGVLNDILLKQADMLKKELEIKNKQIEELNERLSECQKLLDQQQQLTAMTEQKLMLLESAKEEPEEEPEEIKWWQWWKK